MYLKTLVIKTRTVALSIKSVLEASKLEKEEYSFEVNNKGCLPNVFICLCRHKSLVHVYTQALYLTEFSLLRRVHRTVL